jgi:two-component system, NtrC family, nitrogen regulation sensor histidine kinase NtrY
MNSDNGIQMKNFRTTWKNLILGSTLIFLAVFFQEYFFFCNSPGRITSAFQKTLHAKEKRVISELNTLSKEFHQEENIQKQGLSEKDQKIFEEDGLAFFFLEYDSLVYWSVNSIPGIENLKDDARFSGKMGLLKLKNGWYEFIKEGDSSKTFLGLILLENSFPFKNEYLTDQFQNDFSTPDGTKILPPSSVNSIFSVNGKALLSLEIPDKIHPSGVQYSIIFLLYVLGGCFILLFISGLYNNLERRWGMQGLLFISFCIDVILLRIIQFSLKLPSILYENELFGPGIYSSSWILPSLGDTTINLLLLLFISYSFYKKFSGNLQIPKAKRGVRIFFSILFLFMVIAGFVVTLMLVKDLVVNSSFSFNLQNVASLDTSSVIGLFCIFLAFLSYFLFSFPLLFSTRNFLALSKRKAEEPIRISLSLIVFHIILFSLASTFVLNYYNKLREEGKRKMIALDLGVGRDPKIEIMFSIQEMRLMNDSITKGLGTDEELNFYRTKDDSLVNKIRSEYFREGWENYIIQLTLCTPTKVLRIKPQEVLLNCDSYFQNIIKEFGKNTGNDHLFFLDYGNGYKNYIGVIPIGKKSPVIDRRTEIYIEISSKLVLKDQGYPGLLTDNSKEQIRDISEYSYAFYKDDRLIQRFGSIDFHLDLDSIFYKPRRVSGFHGKEGISYYSYPVNKNGMIIISKKNPSILDLVAPFSYLFLFFSFGSLLFISVLRFRNLNKITFSKMGERIQIWMIGVLIAAFTTIGVLIVLYINKLNTQKDNDNLNERAHSMVIEFQSKFSTLEDLKEQNRDGLDELLVKFSNVFFSDVNLYDPQGRLISSSRPEIFEEGLVSGMMNNLAFQRLTTTRTFSFVLKEKIGANEFNSAYLPLFNSHSKLLGYINLPYFAREEKTKHEISSFLVTFINAYAFLIILGIFISLITSYYIAYPLRILTTKIGHITLGKTNEKINWTRKDEIGKLIEEYNLMVDELERSAEILIKSERESAWREMAKQIAHEIKNPLTPMKLSVQYLEKAWVERASDWEQRLHRFGQTMIEQIEALSSIATEFSNFAQLPVAKNEPVKIHSVLTSVLELYKNFPQIRYEHTQAASEWVINADKKQLSRAFTNLINNAMQAIETKTDGKVIVLIEEVGQKIVIRISDNGIGIPKEKADNIFVPNFTTKTGGMGLGLAIVKNIIIEAEGEITFYSEPGKGATFIIGFNKINS